MDFQFSLHVVQQYYNVTIMKKTSTALPELWEKMVICAMVVVKNEKKLFSQDDFLFWAISDENLTFMSSANDF